MCRLLGYLGPSILLDRILCKPEHSLIIQSYQPREMTSGLLNADGFGVGWHHPQQETDPFTYKSTVPIWNEVNISSLSRYVESNSILAYVRSATAGQALDLSNCQPFVRDRILFVHNGAIKHFRQTLYRPIRNLLSDRVYQSIDGTTDSEHIFALFNELRENNSLSLEDALYKTLTILAEMANPPTFPLSKQGIELSANVIISDGSQLVASRFALGNTPPSLYWLRDDPTFPEAVIIASEPLFAGNWHSCPEQSIISVGKDFDINIRTIS
ncbi:ergothioneine biosynthesis protein EgtC [Kamptonema animale CS-326]|jgi:ergothioneine biosynthesis protein EgtC|uniref:ergothioneine biosynthesis protein EgtC n=1 Tax=Kamptonema animale TaxID=92934 RepID=UPI00232AD9F5|nr:ergothioneine biosynthesis protein EgtC [Kamptonema animale]MDB9509986.1 ergothioneine biosynthesis protein EgtC [Kamptonema animale CS-326]